MPTYYITGTNILGCTTKVYDGDVQASVGAKRLLRNRGRGPASEIYVHSGGGYSGPDPEAYIDKAAFKPDGETVGWFPAGTL